MGYTSVTLKPGIDVEQTPVLNSAGWAAGNNVRFFEGLPQKIGGWTTLCSTALTNYGRGIHSWADNTGVAYAAIGTADSLELFSSGALYDITPVTKTSNITPSFTTTNGSNIVKVTDTAHGAATGDRINIYVPVSVGGIVLYGPYVVTLVDANNYNITAASNATSSVSNTGAVPSFTTATSSGNVSVTLNNHGLTPANLFTVQVSTVVSSFTLSGIYNVFSVTNANVFVIQPGGTAAGTATVSENSGNALIQYYLASGLVSTAYVTGTSGYGLAGFGAGPYGGGAVSGTYLQQLRYWGLSNFGQNLVANYSGGPLYIWTPPNTGTNAAVQLNTTNYPGATDPPTQVNYSFASSTQQMIICLGANDPGTSNFNPTLVRWCDAGDFTAWTPKSTNQAGSFKIPSGSTLVSGISTANFNIIWTNTDMWLMSYLGAPLVWGFQKIADAVDIISPQAAGVLQNMVFWPSSNGFFMYSGGGVREIPCPVWDKFWFNLNRLQAYKINVQVNSYFNEISWGYPSASGNGEVDSRVTYNLGQNVWTYDNVARTSWMDENVFGAPAGCDTSLLLQQHESTYNAAGVALPASITSGWFAISEGDIQTFIERMIVDVIATGGGQQVNITIRTKNYPSGPVNTFGPYTYTADGVTGPPYSIIRARGRLAQITIGSTGPDVFWRLGRIRLLLAGSGKGN